MNKKLAVTALSLSMVLALTACGGEKKPTVDTNNQQQEITQGVVGDNTNNKVTKNDLSQYFKVGETYGNLTAVKDEFSNWRLVHKDNSEYISAEFEEVVGFKGKILLVKKGTVQEKYEMVNLALYNVETGDIIKECKTFEDNYSDGDTVDDLNKVEKAIFIRTEQDDDLIINVDTLKEYLGGNPHGIDGTDLVVLNNSGIYTFINLEKDILLDGEYEDYHHIIDYDNGGIYTDVVSDGKITVKKDGYWGCIDLEGNVVLDFLYDTKPIFHNGVAPVKYGDNWAIVNEKAEFVIKPIYNEFIGYADKDYKYLIFSRDGKEYSGAELIKNDGTVVIPEGMLILDREDYPRNQEYVDFFVNEEKNFIFAYEEDMGDYTLMVHNLDGSIRFVHQNTYITNVDYACIGEEDNKDHMLETQEIGFDNGPILLYNDSSFLGSDRYYYLFEDGTISDEEAYEWAMPFQKSGYAVAKAAKNDENDNKAFYVLDKELNVVKTLGYDLDYFDITDKYVIYWSHSEDAWYFESITEDIKFGPFNERKIYNFTLENKSEYLYLVKDAATNLWGVFINGELVIDTIYPEITVNEENTLLILSQGANKQEMPISELFK